MLFDQTMDIATVSYIHEQGVRWDTQIHSGKEIPQFLDYLVQFSMPSSQLGKVLETLLMSSFSLP